MRAFFVKGWTMILKVVSGSSNNVQEIWPGDFAQNQVLAEITDERGFFNQKILQEPENKKVDIA